MRKYFLCLLSVMSLLLFTLKGQHVFPFQAEIQAFKKLDSLHPPVKSPILFVGSSSFTKWKSMDVDFSGYPVLNRGFGGSSLTDMIRYADQTILQYNPKQIYIYCGENDLASSDTITPVVVLNRFIQLYNIIRGKLGSKVPLVYISIKPSIARWQLENKFLETNQLIKKFLDKKKNSDFLDVHTAMLDEGNRVMKDLFIADQLHMNEKGYSIWIKLIKPTLILN